MKTITLGVIAATLAVPALATGDGTCSHALYMTRMGEPSNRIEMLKAIKQKCAPGDKITLPKSETYLVSTACDLNKQVVDLSPYVLCVMVK